MTILADTKYEYFGCGRFGRVFKTTDTKDGCYTVTKQCRADTSKMKDDKAILEVFRSIGKHRHVVDILTCALGHNILTLTSEYCDIGDLHQYMMVYRPSLTVQIKVLSQTCSALAYLHRQRIVHGHLIPHNVLLTSSQSCHVIKVSDVRLRQVLDVWTSAAATTDDLAALQRLAVDMINYRIVDEQMTTLTGTSPLVNLTPFDSNVKRQLKVIINNMTRGQTAQQLATGLTALLNNNTDITVDEVAVTLDDGIDDIEEVTELSTQHSTFTKILQYYHDDTTKDDLKIKEIKEPDSSTKDPLPHTLDDVMPGFLQFLPWSLVQRFRLPRNCCTVVVDDISLGREDLETLTGENWLEDKVINAYLSMLCSESSKSHLLLQSYLAEAWLHNEHSSWLYETEDFSQHQLILVPINARQSHWLLLVCDNDRQCVYVLNSLPSPAYATYYYEEWMHFLELRHKKLQIQDSLPHLQLSTAFKSRKQTDENSCGVFVLMNAEALCRGEDPSSMRQKHVDLFRRYACMRLRQYGVPSQSNKTCEHRQCVRPVGALWLQCQDCTALHHSVCADTKPGVVPYTCQECRVYRALDND